MQKTLKEAIRRLPIPVLWQKLGLLGTVNNYCCFCSRDDESLAIVFRICPRRLCWTNHAPGGDVERYLHKNLETIRATTKLIPVLPK